MDYIKNTDDRSNSFFYSKNKNKFKDQMVEEIEKINPDLLICYGASLIKKFVIKKF